MVINSSTNFITLVRMLFENDAGLSTRWNVGVAEAITRHRTKRSDRPDRRSTMCRSRRGLNRCSLFTPSRIQLLSMHVPGEILYAYTHTLLQPQWWHLSLFFLCKLLYSRENNNEQIVNFYHNVALFCNIIMLKWLTVQVPFCNWA